MFLLSHQYPIYIALLPHSSHIPCPSHPPRLDHSNYTWRRVQAIKLRLHHFNPAFYCRHSLGYWDIVAF
jgi:hypothetical protein